MSTPTHRYIVCDPDKCMGCQICEFICSATKEGEFDPLRSRIRNVRIEPVVMLSVACRNCSDSPCVISCPRNALAQSRETGTVHVDTELCNGCGWCVGACEFGAILLNPRTKKVAMCDLCAGEEKGPQCVLFCPKEALSLSTPEEVAQKSRRNAVSKLFKDLG
jgi:anaerobic carbon-monoxide dehydrogenase iron sulfur subunit